MELRKWQSRYRLCMLFLFVGSLLSFILASIAFGMSFNISKTNPTDVYFTTHNYSKVTINGDDLFIVKSDNNTDYILDTRPIINGTINHYYQCPQSLILTENSKHCYYTDDLATHLHKALRLGIIGIVITLFIISFFFIAICYIRTRISEIKRNGLINNPNYLYESA